VENLVGDKKLGPHKKLRAPRRCKWNSPGFSEPAIPPLSAIHLLPVILPRSQGNSRPKPRLARCREAAALTSPEIGATPPARNEWPIITPSAEDKPVEFHLQRRGTCFLPLGRKGFAHGVELTSDS